MPTKPSKPKKTAATSGDVAADPVLEQLGQAFAEARKEADEWAAAQPVEPREVDREAAIRFLNRPINLGRPVVPVPAPGRRGPKSKKTVYDLAYERRRDLYRRLVKLPALRKGSSELPLDQIQNIVRDLDHEGYPEQKRAPEIRRRMLQQQSGDVLRMLGSARRSAMASVPDVSTIRKVLKASRIRRR